MQIWANWAWSNCFTYGALCYFTFIDKKERELQAERAIPIYDVDKNYRLSTNEFYKLIDERVTPRMREKFVALFNETDRDKNGELTLRELESMIGINVKSSIVEGMSSK